jgi:hypothetical protein
MRNGPGMKEAWWKEVINTLVKCLPTSSSAPIKRRWEDPVASLHFLLCGLFIYPWLFSYSGLPWLYFCHRVSFSSERCHFRNILFFFFTPEECLIYDITVPAAHPSAPAWPRCSSPSSKNMGRFEHHNHFRANYKCDSRRRQRQQKANKFFK